MLLNSIVLLFDQGELDAEFYERLGEIVSEIYVNTPLEKLNEDFITTRTYIQYYNLNDVDDRLSILKEYYLSKQSFTGSSIEFKLLFDSYFWLKTYSTNDTTLIAKRDRLQEQITNLIEENLYLFKKTPDKQDLAMKIGKNYDDF